MLVQCMKILSKDQEGVKGVDFEIVGDEGKICSKFTLIEFEGKGQMKLIQRPGRGGKMNTRAIVFLYPATTIYTDTDSTLHPVPA